MLVGGGLCCTSQGFLSWHLRDLVHIKFFLVLAGESWPAKPQTNMLQMRDIESSLGKLPE